MALSCKNQDSPTENPHPFPHPLFLPVPDPHLGFLGKESPPGEKMGGAELDSRNLTYYTWPGSSCRTVQREVPWAGGKMPRDCSPAAGVWCSSLFPPPHLLLQHKSQLGRSAQPHSSSKSSLYWISSVKGSSWWVRAFKGPPAGPLLQRRTSQGSPGWAGKDEVMGRGALDPPLPTSTEAHSLLYSTLMFYKWKTNTRFPLKMVSADKRKLKFFEH